MAANRPFLVRVQEQAKRFADLPEVTRAITDAELLEDVRVAHSDIYEGFSKAISPEARYWRGYWDTPAFTEKQRFLSLPATFRKFFELRRWNTERTTVLSNRPHVSGTGGRFGVVMLPHFRRLEFIPVIRSDEVAPWELVFETGPIELHYATALAGSTASTLNMNPTPTVGNYVAQNDYYAGAIVYIVSGVGLDQYNQVKSFDAATDIATMMDDWDTTPDDTSVYEIRPWVPGGAGVYDEIIAWRMALKYRRIRTDDGEAERECSREIKTLFTSAIKAVGDVNTDSGNRIRSSRPGRNRQIWKSRG